MKVFTRLKVDWARVLHYGNQNRKYFARVIPIRRHVAPRSFAKTLVRGIWKI